MVDLGAVGGHFAARMLAEPFEQGGGDPGVAGEQAFAFTEIDHGRFRVEHDPAHLGGQQRPDQQLRCDLLTGGGFAAPGEDRGWIVHELGQHRFDLLSGQLVEIDHLAAGECDPGASQQVMHGALIADEC